MSKGTEDSAGAALAGLLLFAPATLLTFACAASSATAFSLLFALGDVSVSPIAVFGAICLSGRLLTQVQTEVERGLLRTVVRGSVLALIMWAFAWLDLWFAQWWFA